MRQNLFKYQLIKRFCQTENFDFKKFFQQKIDEIKSQGKQLEQNLSQEKLELFQAGFQYMKSMNKKEKDYLWLKKNADDQKLFSKYNLNFQQESFFDLKKNSIWSQVGSSSSNQSQQKQQENQEDVQQEEQTSFDVYLENFKPADKLKVIKTLKTTMGTGLKDTKDFVEKSGEKQIKSGISKADAEKLKEDLEKIGCVILIKQLLLTIYFQIYNGKQSKFRQQYWLIKLNTFLNYQQKSRNNQSCIIRMLQIISQQFYNF